MKKQNIESDINRIVHNRQCKKYYKENLTQMREYNKNYMAEYRKSKKWIEYIQDYYQNPKVKVRMAITHKKYMKKPGVKLRVNKNTRKYYYLHREEILLKKRQQYMEQKSINNSKND